MHEKAAWSDCARLLRQPREDRDISELQDRPVARDARWRDPSPEPLDRRPHPSSCDSRQAGCTDLAEDFSVASIQRRPLFKNFLSTIPLMPLSTPEAWAACHTSNSTGRPLPSRLKSPSRRTFGALLREILDWRLAQYLSRLVPSKAEMLFAECLVTLADIRSCSCPRTKAERQPARRPPGDRGGWSSNGGDHREDRHQRRPRARDFR